jgi:hypothetical protein
MELLVMEAAAVVVRTQTGGDSMTGKLKTAVLLLLTALTPTYNMDMTPEETVRYYFRCMSRKDRAGMDSVVAEECRGADAELDSLKRVELISCVRENSAALAVNSNCCEPYEAAVRATFKIEYANGGGAGFDNGEYHWCLHLVRNSADDGWKIVMSGE